MPVRRPSPRKRRSTESFTLTLTVPLGDASEWDEVDRAKLRELARRSSRDDHEARCRAELAGAILGDARDLDTMALHLRDGLAHLGLEVRRSPRNAYAIARSRVRRGDVQGLFTYASFGGGSRAWSGARPAVTTMP